MYKTAKPFFLLAETPIHAGSGSELGVVDLPIQREKHTEYPVIHSSSLKGSLRASLSLERAKQQILGRIKGAFSSGQSVNLGEFDDVLGIVDEVFGPRDPGNEDAYMGAVTFTDAKILLFPIKSVKGTFAWITCPFVLNRFKRDLELSDPDLSFTIPPLGSGVYVGTNNNLTISRGNKNVIILEEFAFEAEEREEIENLADKLTRLVFPSEKEYDFWREKLKTDLVILPNDDFRDFVKLSTEVVARIVMKRDGSKTNENLWYEENLPADTVLYSLALVTDVLKPGNNKVLVSAEQVMQFVTGVIPSRIQLGGNETIGRGIFSLTIRDKDAF